MLTSAQIAEQLNGELQGSKDLTITTLCEPLVAGKHCVSLVVDKNIIKQLSAVRADLLVVSEFLATTQTQIKVKDPKQALITLLKIFFPDQPEFPRQISDRAYIADSAVIGKNVTIMPFAYIGEEVVIGDNSIIYPQAFVGRSATIGCDCILYPNVTVYHQCRLGNRVTIHSGAVIGADGFGFNPQNNAPAQKIPQKGIVVIEDDVEVGANTAIDRAVMSQTVISKAVKIDNLVHLAHNVCIGENTLIAGQVGVAGSTKIGKNNLFGGQVGVSDHVTIGDNNIMLGKCLVSKNLGDGNIVQGTPARDHRENLQREALISKLLRNQK